MSGRPLIGKLLLQNGLITEQQLEQGLARQVVQGGRLGSNLVEMGVVQLNAIAEVLSHQLGVHAATPDELKHVDHELIARIPKQLLAATQAFPMKWDAKWLHLAMVDPQRRELVGAVESALSCKVSPYIVPQLRLLYLLEKHCGIPRAKRFVREAKTISDAANSERRTYLTPSKSPEPLENLDLVYLDQHTDNHRAVRIPTAEFDIEFTVDEDIEAIAGEGEIIARIEQSPDRSTLLDLLIQPLSASTTLSVVLLLREQFAVGIAGSGSVSAKAQISQLVVPIGGKTSLDEAIEKQQVISAAVEGDPVQELISHYMQVPNSKQACVLPIRIAGRIEILVMIQSSDAFESSDLSFFQEVTVAASTACQRMIDQKLAEEGGS